MRELSYEDLKKKAAYTSTYLYYVLNVVKRDNGEFRLEKVNDMGDGKEIICLCSGTSSKLEAFMNGLLLKGKAVLPYNSESLKQLRIKASQLSTNFNFYLEIKKTEDFKYELIKTDDETDEIEVLVSGNLEDCSAYLGAVYKVQREKELRALSRYIED